MGSSESTNRDSVVALITEEEEKQFNQEFELVRVGCDSHFGNCAIMKELRTGLYVCIKERLFSTRRDMRHFYDKMKLKIKYQNLLKQDENTYDGLGITITRGTMDVPPGKIKLVGQIEEKKKKSTFGGLKLCGGDDREEEELSQEKEEMKQGMNNNHLGILKIVKITKATCGDSFRVLYAVEYPLKSLSQLQRISESECWNMLEQLTETLKFLEEKGKFHGDLQSTSVFISEEGNRVIYKLPDTELLQQESSYDKICQRVNGFAHSKESINRSNSVESSRNNLKENLQAKILGKESNVNEEFISPEQIKELNLNKEISQCDPNKVDSFHLGFLLLEIMAKTCGVEGIKSVFQFQTMNSFYQEDLVKQVIEKVYESRQFSNGLIQIVKILTNSDVFSRPHFKELSHTIRKIKIDQSRQHKNQVNPVPKVSINHVNMNEPVISNKSRNVESNRFSINSQQFTGKFNTNYQSSLNRSNNNSTQQLLDYNKGNAYNSYNSLIKTPPKITNQINQQIPPTIPPVTQQQHPPPQLSPPQNKNIIQIRQLIPSSSTANIKEFPLINKPLSSLQPKLEPPSIPWRKRAFSGVSGKLFDKQEVRLTQNSLEKKSFNRQTSNPSLQQSRHQQSTQHFMSIDSPLIDHSSYYAINSLQQQSQSYGKRCSSQDVINRISINQDVYNYVTTIQPNQSLTKLALFKSELGSQDQYQQPQQQNLQKQNNSTIQYPSNPTAIIPLSLLHQDGNKNSKFIYSNQGNQKEQRKEFPLQDITSSQNISHVYKGVETGILYTLNPYSNSQQIFTTNLKDTQINQTINSNQNLPLQIPYHYSKKSETNTQLPIYQSFSNTTQQQLSHHSRANSVGNLKIKHHQSILNSPIDSKRQPVQPKSPHQIEPSKMKVKEDETIEECESANLQTNNLALYCSEVKDSRGMTNSERNKKENEYPQDNHSPTSLTPTSAIMNEQYKSQNDKKQELSHIPSAQYLLPSNTSRYNSNNKEIIENHKIGSLNYGWRLQDKRFSVSNEQNVNCSNGIDSFRINAYSRSNLLSEVLIDSSGQHSRNGSQVQLKMDDTNDYLPQISYRADNQFNLGMESLKSALVQNKDQAGNQHQTMFTHSSGSQLSSRRLKQVRTTAERQKNILKEMEDENAIFKEKLNDDNEEEEDPKYQNDFKEEEALSGRIDKVATQKETPVSSEKVSYTFKENTQKEEEDPLFLNEIKESGTENYNYNLTTPSEKKEITNKFVKIQDYLDFGNQLEVVIEKYEDGAYYDGQRLNGLRCGDGKFVYSDGARYEGQWKNGSMNGYGKLYYKTGSIAYEGQWKSDRFHGRGVLYNHIIVPNNKDKNTSALIQSFCFKNNQEDSASQDIYNQGSSQIPGQNQSKAFEENQEQNKATNPKEFGEVNYADLGSIGEDWFKFDGEFLADEKYGFGTYYFINNSKFSGDFKKDAAEGVGTFYFSNGAAPLVGEWRNNLLVQVFSIPK